MEEITGVWKVCLMGEKCPSPSPCPYKPLSPLQVQEPLSTMFREACLERPHVAKAKVAFPCWQPLP